MFYKKIFDYLYKIKKELLISLIIFIASFIIGFFFPNLIKNYIDWILKGAAEKASFGFAEISLSLVLTNIGAASLGIFLGVFIIPTVVFSFLNGYTLGAITGMAFANVGFLGVLMRVAPHGIIEIPTAIISYALGFSIALVFLKGIRKKENKKIIFKNLFNEYKNSFFVFIGIILPLIIISAFIEGIIFEYRDFLDLPEVQSAFRYVFYALILLYLFYLVLKLIVSYKEKRDMKMIVFASFAVLVSSQMWMRAYGLRVKELLETFTILFSMIPLLVFLFYTYWENQRFREQAAKKQIKDAFQQYMSPAVIEDLLKNPEKLKLGGEKKELTIFFSDIRGFTTISEKFSPEKLVHVLNEYLSAMTEIIIKNRGVVDKYIGDAIMAFWNAPLDEKEHAKLACISAVEMRDKLVELNKKWAKEGISEIKIGIGINTGEVIVGNMGSSQRFDYTIIGDNVNLASRVETLNKVYGTSMVITENTYEKIKDFFICRELDFVMVKGRNKPTRIYELLSKKGEETREIKQLKENFEKGLELYRGAKWEEAAEYFKKNKSDKASEIFIERCEEFRKEKIKNWDGIFEQRRK